jgi:hypothetical protein
MYPLLGDGTLPCPSRETSGPAQANRIACGARRWDCQVRFVESKEAVRPSRARQRAWGVIASNKSSESNMNWPHRPGGEGESMGWVRARSLWRSSEELMQTRHITRCLLALVTVTDLTEGYHSSWQPTPPLSLAHRHSRPRSTTPIFECTLRCRLRKAV